MCLFVYLFIFLDWKDAKVRDGKTEKGFFMKKDGNGWDQVKDGKSTLCECKFALSPDDIMATTPPCGCSDICSGGNCSGLYFVKIIGLGSRL